MGDLESVRENISLVTLNAIEDEMRSFRANRDWALGHLEILRERHGGEYIAIDNGRVVAHACESDLLQERIPHPLRQSSYVLYVNAR